MADDHEDAVRPLTQGLAAAPLGGFDIRTLRFIGAAEHAVGEDVDGPAILPSSPIEARDVRAVGSYSWTAAGTPTILIPGSPPVWKNTPPPFTVRPDTEVFGRAPIYVDHGGGAGQQTALLALAAAVHACTPGFAWPAADVVADRNTLRNLLRWAEHAGTKKCDDFRIDAHLAGARTLVFTRWAQRVRVGAAPGSYGFSYEREETAPAPGCEATQNAGHARIISYDFGGLRLVVAFEVDACLRAPAPVPAPAAQDGTLGPLSFRRAGALAPQTELVELAIRKRGAARRGPELLRQLWLAQTPHFALAVHEGGVVQEVRREHLRESPVLCAAADAAQGGFKRLRGLLDAVRGLVVERGRETRLSLVCRGGHLEVFVRQGAPVMPAEFEAMFP